jgi:hypothetical protein
MANRVTNESSSRSFPCGSKPVFSPNIPEKSHWGRFPALYPHLVTSQAAGMWYSIFVVGRAVAVDRVQTFDCGACQRFRASVLIEAGVVSGLFSFLARTDAEQGQKILTRIPPISPNLREFFLE